MKKYSFKFNEHQLEKLADIASDIALVSLASVVLPAVLDKYDTPKVLLGGFVTIFFWMVSLWLRR